MWLVFSLLAAICFGMRGILYQWTSKKPANQSLMLFGVFFMGAIASVTVAWIRSDPWEVGSIIGCLMGLWSFIANFSMYKGYAVGKASLIALFTGLPPVIVAVLAYLLWNQTLSIIQWFAFLAMVCGILIIRYSGDLSLDNLKGLQWAIITMLCFGFNDITTTQSMRMDLAILPTLFFMFSTGSLLFGLSWYITHLREKRNSHATNHTSDNKNDIAQSQTAATSSVRTWRASTTILWGMVVGLTNFVGMIFIMQAFARGIAGLVSAVTALNVLIIIVYAGVFLKERFTFKEWIGGLCALAGVFTLHLAG